MQIPIDISAISLLSCEQRPLTSATTEATAARGDHPMPGTLEASPAAQQKGLTAEEKRVLQSVLAAIRRIRYGYVQIVLHEGRVVQIDRLEKERF